MFTILSGCLTTILFLLNFLLVTAASAETSKNVSFDLNKSSIAWTGSKVSASHNGSLKLKSATGKINSDKSLSGEFIVDMSSLEVLDIEDPKYNKKLKDHLSNEDFFNTSIFPAVEFRITDAKPIASSKAGEANYTINGDLSIKGISKPISFPAVVEIKDNKLSAKGKAVVNRINYDIKYNSGSFFQNLGDKLIKDEFTVEVNLEGQIQS